MPRSCCEIFEGTRKTILEQTQNYVSNYLHHFVGGKNPEDDKANFQTLMKIIREGVLLGPSPLPKVEGRAQFLFDPRKPINFRKESNFFSPYVCFCDIPSSQITIHTQKYGKFGISFSKEFLIQKGASPVIYIPEQAITRESVLFRGEQKFLDEQNRSYKKIKDNSQEATLKKIDYFDAVVSHYIKDESIHTRQYVSKDKSKKELMGFYTFIMRHFFCQIKWFNDSLPEDDPSNFYMEREWRCIGDIAFKEEDIQEVFVHPDYLQRLKKENLVSTKKIKSLEI